MSVSEYKKKNKIAKISEDITPSNWVETYFKDKIDWKRFNSLCDKLTKYEDKGYVVNIRISVYDDSGFTGMEGYYVIYFHYNDGGIYIDSLLDQKIQAYKKNGFYYMVKITKSDDSTVYLNSMLLSADSAFSGFKHINNKNEWLILK